uniref:Uncharacterized protein n=1 Tax=Ciona intestinalis TaxID=7719 RepID=F6PQU7_CIOIN
MIAPCFTTAIPTSKILAHRAAHQASDTMKLLEFATGCHKLHLANKFGFLKTSDARQRWKIS